MYFLGESGKVQIFGNNLNNQSPIQEEIKSRECLLSFDAESFAIQNFKDEGIQN